jgi:hypothetical protein
MSVNTPMNAPPGASSGASLVILYSNLEAAAWTRDELPIVSIRAQSVVAGAYLSRLARVRLAR